MCGRVIVDYEELVPAAAGTQLGAWITAPPAGATSSFNLKPTQQFPVAFTDHKTGEKRFDTAHWSLVPVWAKDMKLKFATFNARSEGVAEKATFKASVKSRRCVIPVSGFYEWTGPKEQRTPHAIVGPSPLLPLAGLYSWWHEPGAGEDAGWHLTATILTQASAGVMQPLHDRMPVFMSDEMLEDWLDPAVPDDQLLVDAVAEAALPLSRELREWAVRPLRGDGPELLQPV